MINPVELLTKKEKLTPELQYYVRQGVLGEMIHSPWIVEIFFDPEHCALINARYGYKLAEIDKAITEKAWSRYVFLHERPYRLEKLLNIVHLMSEPHKLIRDVWIDSENIHENLKAWKALFRHLSDRHLLMNDDERKTLSALPERFCVYRGGTKRSHVMKGVSWTLNIDKAIWFAKRFNPRGKGYLGKGFVDKKNVIAYFDSRGEEEIVVLSENVEETDL